MDFHRLMDAEVPWGRPKSVHECLEAMVTSILRSEEFIPTEVEGPYIP